MEIMLGEGTLPPYGIKSRRNLKIGQDGASLPRTRINSHQFLSQIHNDKNENDASLVSQNPRFSRKSDIKLLPLDEINNENDVDDDFDFDRYPLIDGGVGSHKGSGISGAVFNLTTTIIGAGIMALPATMKVLGLVLGFVLIVLMGILSDISVKLLVRFSALKNASSYGEVVQCALGGPGRILSEICVIVNNAGVLVVYMMIMGDVLSASAHHVGLFDQKKLV